MRCGSRRRPRRSGCTSSCRRRSRCATRKCTSACRRSSSRPSSRRARTPSPPPRWPPSCRPSTAAARRVAPSPRPSVRPLRAGARSRLHRSAHLPCPTSLALPPLPASLARLPCPPPLPASLARWRPDHASFIALRSQSSRLASPRAEGGSTEHEAAITIGKHVRQLQPPPPSPRRSARTRVLPCSSAVDAHETAPLSCQARATSAAARPLSDRPTARPPRRCVAVPFGEPILREVSAAGRRHRTSRTTASRTRPRRPRPQRRGASRPTGRTRPPQTRPREGRDVWTTHERCRPVLVAFRASCRQCVDIVSRRRGAGWAGGLDLILVFGVQIKMSVVLFVSFTVLELRLRRRALLITTKR